MIDIRNNPYGKYNGNEQEYVLRALDRETPENRDISWTTKLEEKFCEVIGLNYAIACNSGTSGLHAALYAAGIKPGDEVIIPGLTVIMDPLVCIHMGATPIFADVDSKTHNIDPNDIRKKVTSKTKAIIVVALHGLPVNMDPVMEIAKKFNLIIIEDTCQSFLGKYKDKYSGTIGHINVWSFENTKHLSSGSEGGIIATNNERLAIKARKFSGIGYKHLTADAGRTSLARSVAQNPDYERFDTFGLNYRMPAICAAVGLAQVERIQEIVNRRQIIGKMFEDAISGCDWIEPQSIPKGFEHSYYTFAARYYGDEKLGLSWREFYNLYKEKGGDGFYGSCQIPYLEPVFNSFEINGHTYKKGICTVAESVQSRIMQFKTNYRDLDLAKEKVQILRDLIKAL